MVRHCGQPFNDCSQCRTPRCGRSLVLGDLSTLGWRRSCTRGYPSVSESRSSWQRFSTSAWTAWPDVPGWLLSTDWRPSLRNEICGDLDTPRAAHEIHIQRQIICCRRAKHLEQLAACYTRSVTVQSKFQETAKDSPVWITIAARVRLNWSLRNVLVCLLTYLDAIPQHDGQMDTGRNGKIILRSAWYACWCTIKSWEPVIYKGKQFNFTIFTICLV